MNHQPPDWSYKYGHSEIVPNRIYLAGEDDVDDLLYGEDESRSLNGKGFFVNEPKPQIDVWIDLRDIRDSNRKVFVPNNVEYISIPFRDGVLTEAQEFLPIAKDVLSEKLLANKRVLVGCHQGRSRSALLVMWHLTEEMNNFLDAYWHVKSKRPIVDVDKNFQPFFDDLKTKYPSAI